MSRLSLENIEDQEILMRDGVSLHSRKDFAREAQNWAEAQSKVLRQGAVQGPVFILGCGAGHHLRALSEMRPELHLVAVDFDPEIIPHAMDFDLVLGYREALNSQAKVSLIFATTSLSDEEEKKQLFATGYSVLRFRPAWSGFEAQFTLLEASLLDATPESLNTWNAATSAVTDEEKLILALKEVVA